MQWPRYWESGYSINYVVNVCLFGSFTFVLPNALTTLQFEEVKVHAVEVHAIEDSLTSLDVSAVEIHSYSFKLSSICGASD